VINYIFIAGLLLLSTITSAATTSDTINIKKIYSKADGSFAVQGESALVNASNDRDCLANASWDEFWTGMDEDTSERIISVILSAQAQNKSIQVQTDGCVGPWHKISSIYLGN